MPYDWVKRLEAPERSGAFSMPGDGEGEPLAELHLWPHRSLPRGGFVLVIGMAAALLAVPMIALIGTPVLWGLLPFVVLTVWALWAALARSYRDGQVVEVLRLWPDLVRLDRRDRSGLRSWEANPHWVEPRIHRKGPVPAYLTLRGAGREVEIGAFLSEDERQALWPDLAALFAG